MNNNLDKIPILKKSTHEKKIMKSFGKNNFFPPPQKCKDYFARNSWFF
jgi:hypothetical protein